MDMNMRQLVMLIVTVTGVFGGRSLNADYLERSIRENPEKYAQYSSEEIEDAKLDIVGLCAKDGYPLEIHEVHTDDGYILTLYRIPHGRNNQHDPNKPPIIYGHGLMSAANNFLLLGPDGALPYLCADNGYDNWIVNFRGNHYSRRHETLNPDSKISQEFWDFSWDKMGLSDLPAILGYIKRYTGKSEFHYVCHSQGCTAMVALLATKREYNRKLVTNQMMAPAVFFVNNENLAKAATLLPLTKPFFIIFGYEVFYNREFLDKFSNLFCQEGSVAGGLCSSEFSSTSKSFNESAYMKYLGNTPAGCSIQQFFHYAQTITSNKFRRYDYGIVGNLLEYGSLTPPELDVSKINAPTYIYYSANDSNVHPKDAELLASKMSNVKKLHLVDSPSFTHIDFLWGNNVRDLLYNQILSSMAEAEEEWGK